MTEIQTISDNNWFFDTTLKIFKQSPLHCFLENNFMALLHELLYTDKRDQLQ